MQILKGKTRWIVISILMGSFLICVNKGSIAKRNITFSFHVFEPPDHTFQVKIPSGWKAGSAQGIFTAAGPDNDEVSIIPGEFFVDQQSLRNFFAWQEAVGSPLPPELRDGYSKNVSAPLSPVDVIRILFPKEASTFAKMNDIRILATQSLHLNSEIPKGTKAALIHYTYRMNGMPAEGLTAAITFPPVYEQGIGIWHYLSFGTTSRPKVFHKNLGLRLSILKTFRFQTTGPNENTLIQYIMKESNEREKIYNKILSEPNVWRSFSLMLQN